MCYSAQVIQMARKLHRELGCRLDYDEAERLFFQRLDDPTVNISRGFEANFGDPANEQQRRIQAAIEEHHARAATKLEKELFSQKTRLVDAERSLKAKETKKAREDVRIATKKIETLTSKLGDLRGSDAKPDDNRIFPMVYTGVIIKKDGENLLTPMRYFCRPAGKPAFYDKKLPGLYNARRSSLNEFWREQFGQHHAIWVVESFYENVSLHTLEHRDLAAGEKEKNVVLQFAPEPAQPLFVACLWSRWTDPQEPDLLGFAAITDEPPADVASAGHDRCIINLKAEHVNTWLTPENRTAADLQTILSDRAILPLQHAIAEAA